MQPQPHGAHGTIAPTPARLLPAKIRHPPVPLAQATHAQFVPGTFDPEIRVARRMVEHAGWRFKAVMRANAPGSVDTAEAPISTGAAWGVKQNQRMAGTCGLRSTAPDSGG